MKLMTTKGRFVGISGINYSFNEAEARGILGLINKRMAGIFCQPVQKIRIVFLSYIATKGKASVVLGQCLRLSDFTEVQVCIRPGWQKTAIHELAHVYNPDATEERIKAITTDVVKYLKIVGQQK